MYAIASSPKRYETIQPILSWTSSNSASGMPNCRRSLTWSMTWSSRIFVPPTEPVPSDMRPLLSVCIAILKPSPGSPITFSAGMRTSLKCSWRRSFARRPIVS